MKTIIKNRWHLHFPIGMDIMALFLYLFTLDKTSLGYWGGALISMIILAALCFGLELYQDSKGYKQPKKAFVGDFLAGVLGGLFWAITAGFTNIYIMVIVFLIVNIIMGVLHIFKHKFL